MIPRLIPVNIPPGLMRAGTEYQSRGRWYDSSLVRSYEGGAVGPINGWQVRSTSAVSGAGRAILTWTADDGTRWTAIGTHSKLYAMSTAGALSDITPAGFTSGRADATSSTGYGYGTYGTGTYGTPRLDAGTTLMATVWDLEQWAQYLNGCSSDDGKLYEWQLNTGVVAAAIAGAPTSCQGLVVTPQRFVFALGAGANKRKAQWCDQEVNTTWTPSATNQAGDLEIPRGKLLCGKAIGDQTFVLSDMDAYAFDYIGLPSVYSMRRIGENCGAVSKRCMAMTGDMCVWWSKSGFWIYDGAVRQLQCPIWDDLTRDLTLPQISKVSAWYNAEHSEVWWHYQSSTGTENDRYVFWNRKYDHWYRGPLARMCGIHAGTFLQPFLVGTDGYVRDHEIPATYFYDGSVPYIRSGPIEFGDGTSMMRVTGIVPDEKTTGDADISFYARDYPNGTERTIAAATLDGNGKADVRFSARQAEILVTFSEQTNSRFGGMRLIAQPGGRR